MQIGMPRTVTSVVGLSALVLLTMCVFVLPRNTKDAFSCSSPTVSLYFTDDELQIGILAQIQQVSWFGVISPYEKHERRVFL